MPELFNDVPDKPLVTVPEDSITVEKLFRYLDDKMNPWRQMFLETLVKCYNFKELIQWSDEDKAALQDSGVPAIAVDRINRGLDTINGLRMQRNNKRKFVPRDEQGDRRIAELLDRTADYVEDNGGFELVRTEAFQAMLDCGQGIRKIGYDRTGEIFTEYVPTEDFFYSKCKTKTLDDVSWCAQRSVVDWELAMLLFPEKASEIKTMKTTAESVWESQKTDRTANVTSLNKDYGKQEGGENVFSYPDQVELHEFWKLRVIPGKAIRITQITQMPVPGIEGLSVPIQTQQMREAPIDYIAKEGEEDLGATVRKEWWQYITVGSRDSAIIARQAKSKYNWHPYVATCSERKKSGAPRGYIEPAIPHQIRINTAWAQMVAFNNKSIKTPLVVKNVVDVDKLIVQSAIGPVLMLKQMEDVVSVNITPQVNMQAIEEGNLARSDMDFAASATEPVLRGQASAGDSAIKVSGQQQAALLPQNKWVEADKESELAFARKLLEIIITEFPVEKIARIVGVETFASLTGPVVDPMTGQMTAPPIALPLTIDIAQYDAKIQDEALSDFEKQQSFNAAMALHQAGFVMDDEYMILHAPVKDTESALASHRKAKMDIVRQLTAIIQQQQAEIESLGKMVPKEGTNGQKKKPTNQAANAVRGRQQPQAGANSMIGGMSPASPVGLR